MFVFWGPLVAMAPGADMGMNRRKFTPSNDYHFKWGAIAEATFEQGEDLYININKQINMNNYIYNIYIYIYIMRISIILHFLFL